MQTKRLAIVGAAGSIGTQTIDIVRHFPDELHVVALAGGSRVEPFADQLSSASLKTVVMADADAVTDVKQRLGAAGRTDVHVGAGDDALLQLVTRDDVDLVVMGMVGARALPPTLAALEAGKDVAIATKEVLVAAGELVTNTAARNGARLLPVDSEHNAIFQCLQGEDARAVDKLILTASGGPFRETPAGELPAVTPARALRHPTWDMGAKVTIDSATLMNKGLEVIEARWLFDMPVERIRVVVHPQSIVHSAVQFVDGSIIAHMGPTDMRVPIQHALFYPRRVAGPMRPLSLADVGTLTFEEPDVRRIPGLELAYAAARAGGTMPAVFNAANEIAVELFLAERIRFTDIAHTVERVMAAHDAEKAELDAVLAADEWARRTAYAYGNTTSSTRKEQ